MTHVIRYRFRLLEPLIASALVGEPNSSVSYDYIPGSVIRGWFIGTEGHSFNAANADFQRLYFTGATRFLNAYLVDPSTNQRTVPVPLSWQRPKGKSDVIYDRAVHESSNDEKLKSAKGFVQVDGQVAYLHQVKRDINLHIQRMRSNEKSRQSEVRRSELYRYDALAAGQTFEGVILCDNQADVAYLSAKLNDVQTLTIGGARTAGYGRVRLEGVEPLDNWTEVASGQVSKHTTLTLLSDLILRDYHGNYLPTLVVLAEALGFNPQDVVYSSLDTTMVGGFNRKWGMPLPQTLAFKTGSVLVISDSLAFTDAEFSLGERQAEGFGRVAINWQVQAKYEVVENKTIELETLSAIPDVLNDHANILWGRIKDYSFEKRVETALSGDIFTSDKFRVRGKITKTQLARLRLEIAHELRQETPQIGFFTDFFQDIQGKYAGKAFDDAWIGTEPLRRWIENFLQKSSEVDVVKLKFIDMVLERAQKDREDKNG